MTKPESLDEAIVAAGGAVPLLRNSQSLPWAVPFVPAEYSNWRDEQLAWRTSAVVFDQSHHMKRLVVEGPDALKILSNLGINSFANFPVDKAKQFVAVSHDGYLIGDAVLVHVEEDRYELIGTPVLHWVRYHALTGPYDVRVELEENSATRQGPPELYRYQVQGPKAMDVMRGALGYEAPKLPFFSMTRFTIAGKEVRALRHGMAGEPGFEFWGPWADGEVVLDAILEAGREYDIRRVGALAYPTNALESGWVPRPIPAIYSGEAMAPYRKWLRANSFEGNSPLGGSFYSEDVADYYLTPYDLDYGRIVAFDHDFIGREALERFVAEGRDTRKRKVTLVWHGEDVEKAIGSAFRPGLGAKSIKLPLSVYNTYQFDSVTSGGRQIGLSTWTGYSSSEKAMLSLATVDSEFAEPGTEVEVVWGESPVTDKPTVEDHQQITIRATVNPAPLTEKARTSYRANS
ncbi:aminomethyltransferase family protein [Okibacterium endophyticum]